MIRSGVIGFPVKHSRSPLIHGYWLKRHGIDGRYDKIEVAPDGLKAFLAGMREAGFAGCNVTLPHKEQAASLIPNLDERAHRIGSVNTVYFSQGELSATSSDGYGFVQNLRWRNPSLDLRGCKVVMLGAGGSARAIVDELLQEGVAQVTVANRTVARAAELAQNFGSRVVAVALHETDQHLRDCGLLINTTSAGIADTAKLSVAFDRLPRGALVTDISYVPLLTPFLADAQRAGCLTTDGLGMLLHQAVPGFELWFGIRPEVTDELYDIVAGDIAPGTGS